MINFKIPTSDALIPLGDEERALYERLVPEDHYLRRVLRAVDFDRLSSILALSYSPVGSRPLDPIVMLKLEILSRQNDLSDRSVIEIARFDIAIRLFLGLSIHSPLPHHTSLTYFRQRVGSERIDEVFDELVGQARRLGLVKDRLRLKDATHIIANIAVPSAIGLIAQTRDQLLRALQPFAAERVREEQECVEAIRLRTNEQKDQVRLVQRVVHLRAVLAWADGVPEQEIFHQQSEKARANLTSALATAHKVLEDSANPDAKDRILTTHDPDARCGKHGKYYDGYMVDIIEDADSEIITKMKVLPGNGDEGADTVDLIVGEEAAHGNDIEAVSTDGAGYRGDVLRELTDPDGLDLEAFVPPSEPRPAKGFPAELFVLELIGGRATVSCPGGHTTTTRTRNSNDTGYQYRFDESQC
jgi:transposase